MTRDGEATLPAERQLWVADALLDGHALDGVVATLIDAGTPADVAREAVEAIAASPALLVARRRLRAHRLRQEVARAGRGRVDVRTDLDADTFRDTYVALGVPVVIPGFCAHWPSARWTLPGLAARLGDVPVDVCVGRTKRSEPDRAFREVTRTMPLSAYVERVLAAGVTNDLYMIAQHRNLDDRLVALLDDLAPPPGFADRGRLRGNTSLWIGPAGTTTPLHHDTTSVLFCQVVGRKRVRLVPPFADRVAATARDFYATIDLDDPAVRAPGGPLDGVPLSTVELDAGDALLLPAGWWHEITATSVSVSVSIVALPWPNRFDFYVAGAR